MNISRSCLIALYLIGVTLVFPVCAQDAFHDPDFKEGIKQATNYLDSLRKAQHIPSISVAVGVKGKLIWKEAMGMADLAKAIPATTETKYRVGSIAKPMTAFGLAVLFDSGKLDWDDPVGQYVPAFENKQYPITIRQVAGHQAGIRHYKGFEYLSTKQYGSVLESMQIFQDDPLLFEPGTKYHYSTYGYVALSRVIEQVSGKDYLTFMKQDVFAPLAMNNTVAENADFDELNKATFYNKRGKKEAAEVNLSSKWAGGGFLSTPEDLVNMVNRATRIISAQTLFSMIKPQTLSNEEPTDYGIGWRYTKVQSADRVLIHHGGTSVGARAFLMFLLNEQIVVAICTNAEADYNAQEVYNVAKFFLSNP